MGTVLVKGCNFGKHLAKYAWAWMGCVSTSNRLRESCSGKDAVDRERYILNIGE
jgi:hypothetical protein